MLEILDLTKSYKMGPIVIPALKALCLQVTAGEILGLLGPNGAGKTTTVKLIMGFLSPSAGAIHYQGRGLAAGDPRAHIGYLPEILRPNPYLNVGEYVRLHARLTNRPGRTDGHSVIDSYLERVGMSPFKKRRISSLSKGMTQRVGLAQALVGDPSFLILDEPTAGLDPIGKSDVVALLTQIKQEGKTVLLCSHTLSEVAQLCDRIGILVKGELRFLGTIDAFCDKWKTADLGEAFRGEVC